MWRRLFGGGDPKNLDPQAKKRAQEQAAERARDAMADSADADSDASEMDEADEIPFEDHELPEFGDEAEAEAHVHAGLARDPENPDAPVPAPEDAAAGSAAATPHVQLHDAGSFEKHVEEISPYEDRPSMAREEYELLVADLPMPRKKHMREFAEYVSSALPWHEQLPLLPSGEPFRFYLNPFAGMDRMLLGDGRAAFIPRSADAERFQESWLPTEEYRQRFGFLCFSCAAAERWVKPVRLQVDTEFYEGVLDNNVNYAVLWVPKKPFNLPDAILKAGTCMVTGVVHPRAACPSAWQRTLETVKSNHAWPVETGGPATLARIRERVASTGPVQNIDPELQALLAPERQRLLDAMTATMTRMVEQIHGAL